MASKLTGDPVYTKLRKVRPAKVYAVVDGELRALAIGNGRAKWERAIELADKLNAEGLELHDENDNVLDLIPLHEEEKAAPLAKQGTTEASVEYLMRVHLDAVDRAVVRHLEQQQQVMDAALKLMELSTERSAQLERALGNAVRAQEKLLASLPEGSAARSGLGLDDIMAMVAAGAQSGLIDVSKLGNLAGLLPMLTGGIKPTNGSG